MVILSEAKDNKKQEDIENVSKYDATSRKLSKIPLEIEHYRNLKKLELPHNEITSIDVILPKTLEHLNLKCNGLKRIEGLYNLSNLKILNLSHNKLIKIEGLDKLHNLHSLNLSYNYIKRMENIGHLYKLTNLNVGNNHIEKIRDLENLSSLKTLNIEFNDIVCLRRIFHLFNLEVLNLDGTKVKEISQGFERLANLKHLYSRHNVIVHIYHEVENRIRNKQILYYIV